MTTYCIPEHTESSFCQCTTQYGATQCSRKARYRFVYSCDVKYSCGIGLHMKTLTHNTKSYFTQEKNKEGKWRVVEKTNHQSTQSTKETPKETPNTPNTPKENPNTPKETPNKLTNTKQALLSAQSDGSVKQLKYQLHPDKHPSSLRWLFEEMFKVVNV